MGDVLFTISPIKQADFIVTPSTISLSVTNMSSSMSVLNTLVSVNVQNTLVGISVVEVAPVSMSVSSMGAKGLQGVQGIQGIAGGSYTHVQGTATTVWNIPHNLGFYPNVSVRDSSNRNVFTDINHIDQNNTQVIIVNAFTGTAYLS